MRGWSHLGSWQSHSGSVVTGDRRCWIDAADSSRALMDEVWEATTGQFKDAYPDVCSNVYLNRNG